MTQFDRDVQLDLHRRMVRIRLFEEAAGQLAEAAKLPGFLHLYVGQEAVASGVCAALTDDDQITSNHRGHGHLVAKGGQFNQMMAEIVERMFQERHDQLAAAGEGDEDRDGGYEEDDGQRRWVRR